MEHKCESSLNIRDKNNILAQFNFNFFLLASEGILFFYDLWGKSRGKCKKYWKNQGKVREFLKRKKVGSLFHEKF